MNLIWRDGCSGPSKLGPYNGRCRCVCCWGLLHFFEAAEFWFDAEEVDGEDLDEEEGARVVNTQLPRNSEGRGGLGVKKRRWRTFWVGHRRWLEPR